MNGVSDELPRKRLTRAEAKAQTRARLLDSAAFTFAQRGYAGASVEEIAERAGYSVGALYSNFGSKDELFVELLSERASARVAEAAHILSEETVEAEDPAEALGRLLIAVADKDVHFAPLQAEFWLYATRNPDTMHVLATQSRQTREALAEVITRRLTDIGQPLEAPQDAVATVVLALFQGLAQQRRTDHDSVPDHLFGQALSWLFSGIAAGRPPSSAPEEG